MMKIEIETKVQKDAVYFKVDAGVRYWEDSTINEQEDSDNGDLIPCKNGDRWQPIIDIDSGIIINWEQGKKAEIHYKVCDDGKYSILDEDKDVIIEKDCYVPSILCPRGEGFGDYIIMDIDENGKIDKWDNSEIQSFLETESFNQTRGQVAEQK